MCAFFAVVIGVILAVYSIKRNLFLKSPEFYKGASIASNVAGVVAKLQ